MCSLRLDHTDKCTDSGMHVTNVIRLAFYALCRQFHLEYARFQSSSKTGIRKTESCRNRSCF